MIKERVEFSAKRKPPNLTLLCCLEIRGKRTNWMPVPSGKQLKADLKGSTLSSKFVVNSYGCFCKVTSLAFNYSHTEPQELLEQLLEGAI